MASALSCVICHDSDQRLRFFHVPSDTERLKVWSNLVNLEIKCSAIICEKHFLGEHFTNNLEFDCWRLNSKAIPTMHLTDEDVGDYKLINEFDFDEDNQGKDKENPRKGLRNAGTQTKKPPSATTSFQVKCLWCDDYFDTPDLCDILKHFKAKHRFEIICFLDDPEDEMPQQNDYIKEETMDTQENSVENCDYEEIDVDGTPLNKSDSMDCNDNQVIDDCNDSDGVVNAYFEEECDVINELVVISNQNEDEVNSEENLNVDVVQSEYEPLDNMLQNNGECNNQINIETSEPSLIFFIIELLQSNPTIWFINGFRSKEYEAGLKNLYIQFSEKYECFTTQTQLHESLIEIRDWYQKIYAQKMFDQLTPPQSAYFWKLEEFLPDKPDSKTCWLCGRIFNDHVQYFAHKKMEHPEAISHVAEEKPPHTALECLKVQVNDYFFARYPLRQTFSYACQVCPTKYGRSCKRVFLDHIKKHLDIRDHVCDICGKAFIKLERFHIHRKRHFGLHKSKCGICGKEFTNFSLLTAHRTRYHRPIEGTIEEIEQLQRARKMYKSQIYYVPIEEDNCIIFGCPFCEKTYKHKSGVHQHCKLMHRNQFTIKNERKKPKENQMETHEEQSSDTEIDL